jgi:restriction system protein
MSVPDYQSLMLPVLKTVLDGKEHKFRDIIETLAIEFRLNDEDRKELLPSGQQPIFDNRVGWAKTYLKKAGLVDSPRRATIVITQRGLEVLHQKPSGINVKFLRRFPEFIEFQTSKRDEEESQEEILKQTPEETFENAYLRIRKSLSQELLSKVINLSPSFFERLVVELLVKMGYGGSIKDAGRAIGKTGDEGIDGTIKEDKLGLDIIYIQAKRWQQGNVVGRPEIHKKGIFITTSSFTKDALEYNPKNETKIVLIDGEKLTQYMIDYNLGVTTQQAYEIKRLDNDYFGEE